MGSGLVASPRATRPAKNVTVDGDQLPVTRSVGSGRRSRIAGYCSKQNGLSGFGPPSAAPLVTDNWSLTRLFEYENDQAERAISTGKLNALPRLHIRPIDVVVFHGSSGRTRFEAGFPLRCLQRLSIPYIATLHHRWRDDRSTRDTFTPVLSY